MLTEKQISDFHENGYLLVPGVLSSDEIKFMRKRILGIFDNNEWKKSPHNTERILSDPYNYFPEFIDLTLNERIINPVKSLLGQRPLLMPETSIHFKFYTYWHKDTTSQEKAGNTFHFKPEYLMFEAGFYLQDNDEFGGGLTVMPGSHKTSDIFVNYKEEERTLKKRILNRLFPTKEKDNIKINPHKHKIVDIPSKAGDLVIFNLKTNHRATQPKICKITEVPKDKEKIAFFNCFGANNNSSINYLEYIKSRPEPFYKYIRDRDPDPALIKKGQELGFQAF